MSTSQHVLPLDASGVPPSLRQTARWAVWSAVTRPDGKLTKVPRHPDTLRGLSVNKPEEWCDYDTALRACRRSGVAGLAYLMTGEHGLIGIDLDKCLGEMDEPLPWAQEILDHVRGYVELSPSGTGLRIFVRGSLPGDVHHSNPGVEIYSGHSARYLTVTGQRLPGSPQDIPQADPETLAWLWERYGSKPVVEQRKPSDKPLALSEDDLPSAQELLDLGLSRRDVALLFDPEARFDEQCTLLGQRLDKSGQCFRLAKLLAAYGFSDVQIYSLLRQSAAVMEVAQAHRPRTTTEATEAAADDMIWSRWACKAHSELARQREFTRQAIVDTQFDEYGMVPDAPVADDTPQLAEKFDVKTETKKGVTDERARFIEKRASEFRFYTLAEFMRLERYRQEWLISRVLPAGELGFVVGNRGSGKTFFVLDMIIHLANGWKWRDLKVKPSRVIYYAAEGANGLQNRIAAWEEFNGRSARCQNLILLAPETGLNLSDPVDYAAMSSAVQRAGGADLIVIDTFSQVTPGLDENSGQVMSELIARTIAWARKNRCMVLFVGHTGKNAEAGLRGWSGLQAAADVIITVGIDQKTHEREAVLTKLKEGQDMLRLPFRLERVRFFDQQTNLGDPVESSLAYAVGAPLEPPAGTRAPTLDDVITAAAIEWSDMPEADGQSLDVVRLVRYVHARRPEYTPGVIERAIARLVRAGVLRRGHDGTLSAA